MRSHSRNAQVFISIPHEPAEFRWPSTAIGRLVLAATMMALAMAAPPAWPNDDPVELTPQGRRIQTGPKGPQRALDGVLLEEPVASRARIGTAIDEKRRSIRARPNQPISVGLMGCPGCTVVLDAIGGLFVDVETSIPRNDRKRSRWPRRSRPLDDP